MITFPSAVINLFPLTNTAGSEPACCAWAVANEMNATKSKQLV
jgi:hypothetical protein